MYNYSKLKIYSNLVNCYLTDSIIFSGDRYEWIYRNDALTHRFCMNLMTLRFLPAEQILGILAKLEMTIANCEVIFRNRMVYIRRQWIANRVFPPASWSVFNAFDVHKQRHRKLAHEA